MKSKLDLKQPSDAFNKIRTVKCLSKTAFRPQTGDLVMSETRAGSKFEYFSTLGHIFAYSAIGLDPLAGYLRDLQQDVPVEERIDGIFVLNAGVLLYRADNGKLSPICERAVQIVAIESDNPLLPMTLVLQGKYMGAFSPGLRIIDYLQGATWGTQVSEC